MKKFGMLLFLVILMACSNDTASTEEKGTVSNEEQLKESENAVEDSTANEIHKEIENISLATDIDTLQEIPAGILTEDITYEADTERILFGIEELDPDYLKELIEAVSPIAEDTDDPETIAKSLIYYAGSPSYSSIATELANFKPDFKEPLLPRPEKIEKEGAAEGESSYAYILLDASSSMLLESEGEIRMDIAREAVSSFARTIGASSHVSLVAFGHKGDDSDEGKEASCSKIEEVYSLGEYDEEQFTQSVDTIEAKGWTPLAAAIEKVNELSSSLEGHVTIYIVSDGVETCDGDPVEAAATFADTADNKTVNIIGFQVDEEAEAQLTKVAEAGEGEYYSADNGEELLSTIEYEWLPSTIELTWAPVNMTPNGFDITYERQRASDLSYAWNYSVRRENHRFEAVLNSLVEEETLTEEEKVRVEEILLKREEEIKAISEQLREKNTDAVDKKAEEIKADVNAWVEEMEALKESVQ
ncbi:Ca-activated chloride channel family protein [Gracilibacillus ureilyticus]|uniref:Ca-activated chloride channel family protein n=1 Tax=Gracilibacillus ureilyticus TaxID=531814 RepID=A0A1H9VH07_9BACI|nr:VWA domain-containing protein [Gracilibacillus ureilyticus]SES20507.1 Ca-activated chloride channel family protein [Gracilibacillus ureilyticus]